MANTRSPNTLPQTAGVAVLAEKPGAISGIILGDRSGPITGTRWPARLIPARIGIDRASHDHADATEADVGDDALEPGILVRAVHHERPPASRGRRPRRPSGFLVVELCVAIACREHAPWLLAAGRRRRADGAAVGLRLGCVERPAGRAPRRPAPVPPRRQPALPEPHRRRHRTRLGVVTFTSTRRGARRSSGSNRPASTSTSTCCTSTPTCRRPSG